MGNQIPFTPRTLANLKPAGATYEVREAGRTGLRLRVAPTGTKSFRWVCTSRGRAYTLGRFGDGTGGTITLAGARAELARMKAKHEAGVDPDGLEGAERPKTVKALCDVFYNESIMLRRRRPEVVKDVIDREIVPTIGTLPLVAVDTLAARRVVTRTIQRGARSHAAKVLQTVKQLFNFAAANGFMPWNPAAPLRAADLGVIQNVGDRFLSADEIPAVLAAIDGSGMDPVVRLALRFVFYTGLRTHEALTLEWRDVDMEAATVTVRVENQKITKARAQKGAKPFVQPLSAPALAAVKALRELAPKSTAWVFYSPFAKGGRLNDKSMEHALRRVRLRDLAKLESFSPHDFRRTMATHMSETLRLAPWISQFCLGHSLNRMLGSGVAATYDHAKLLDDRRVALGAYATWIEGLIDGTTAKVIPMAEGSR